MNLVDGILFASATDLSNHLSCNHLTNLNRLVQDGELKRPSWRDPSLDILKQLGKDHEKVYVDFLIGKGLSIINLENQDSEKTLRAMRTGVDVIVQANLQGGMWRGYADILLKSLVKMYLVL